ncbi:MAG: FKBP-type peptidyl-prolyl cis-trans isomerase [Planctomycetota bacterium]
MFRTFELALFGLAFLALAAVSTRAQGDDPPIPADTTILTTESGLRYSVLTPAPDGKKPKAGDKVTVHYTGWLTDGKSFDSSRKRGTPFTFTLGRREVISGWDEGVALMTTGSRFKFTIPYDLAYGENGRPPRIPARATLIFDVELISIESVEVVPAPTMPAFPKEGVVTEESGLRWVLLSGAPVASDARDFKKVRFDFWKTDGTHIMGTKTNRGMHLSGNGMVQGLPFLKDFFGKASPGCRYLVEVPAELAFGEQGMPGKFSGPITTVWDFEVVQHVPFARNPDNAVKKTESGLEYEIIREGTGKKPTDKDRVTVDYVGWLTTGKVFDSSLSRGEPTSFGLRGVIKGWTEGLQLMTPGSIYRFTIPYQLAYGENGSSPQIPPKADLVFWIELKQVN